MLITQLKFIFQSHEELKTTFENIVAKYKEHEVKDQVQIICCGQLDNISCCHVILNEVIWNFKNTLEAVDFSFKLCSTVKLGFPLMCSHVYYFFASFIYKLPKKLKVLAYKEISSFWSELQRIP